MHCHCFDSKGSWDWITYPETIFSKLRREGNVLSSNTAYKLQSPGGHSKDAARRAELAATEEATRNAAGKFPQALNLC